MLSGGARVEGIFKDVYSRNIMDVDVLDDLTAEEIRALVLLLWWKCLLLFLLPHSRCEFI